MTHGEFPMPSGIGLSRSCPRGGARTGRKPTDRGKQGTKRSLLTEAHGVPVGLAVEGANRHDKKLAEATLESIPVERPERHRPKLAQIGRIQVDNSQHQILM